MWCFLWKLFSLNPGLKTHSVYSTFLFEHGITYDGLKSETIIICWWLWEGIKIFKCLHSLEDLNYTVSSKLFTNVEPLIKYAMVELSCMFIQCIQRFCRLRGSWISWNYLINRLGIWINNTFYYYLDYFVWRLLKAFFVLLHTKSWSLES